MSYLSWMQKHAQKHKNIVNKLTGFTDDEIIEYFDFENMKVKEKDFCPLYERDKKCHDMEKLNCYFCGCPYFRLNNDNSEILSFCSINHKNGGQMKSVNGIHQDCSRCEVPHKINYIKTNFSKDWNEVMSKVSNAQ